MQGDNLSAVFSSVPQVFGPCHRLSAFVSTGCKAWQIIIDASLESISGSTNSRSTFISQTKKKKNRGAGSKCWLTGCRRGKVRCVGDRWTEQEGEELCGRCGGYDGGSFVVHMTEVEMWSFDTPLLLHTQVPGVVSVFEGKRWQVEEKRVEFITSGRQSSTWNCMNQYPHYKTNDCEAAVVINPDSNSATQTFQIKTKKNFFFFLKRGNVLF